MGVPLSYPSSSMSTVLILRFVFMQEQEDRANRAKSKKGQRGDESMGKCVPLYCNPFHVLINVYIDIG